MCRRGHTALLSGCDPVTPRQLHHDHAKDIHELAVGLIEDGLELSCVRTEYYMCQCDPMTCTVHQPFSLTSCRLIGFRANSQDSA